MKSKLQFFVAGIQFRPKEEIEKAIKGMEVGDILQLICEPTNKYDPCAVKIICNLFEGNITDDSIFIGYVPKKYSTLVTDMISNKSAVCTVTQVNPEAKTHMMIEVTVEGEL